MKLRKYFLHILLLFVIVAVQLIGCNKFLDKKPLGQAISGDVSQGGEEAAVLGLYANLTGWCALTSWPYLVFHAIRSDDSKCGTPGDGDATEAMMKFQYSKDNWLTNLEYENYMSYVIQASNVIADIDSLQLTDAWSLTNKGEACCLRAFAYFDLVRDYGEVPIINFKVRQASDGNVAKSSVSQVYAQIQKDLAVAIQYLPKQWDSKYIGRVTQGTAQTLLAKAYLYQKNWSQCLTYCNAVISSGVYSLDPSYAHLFTEAGENGTESIFEIQNYESSNGSISYTNSLANIEGVRGTGSWNLGWGWNLPDSNLVLNAYEANDPRLNQTVLFAGQPDGVYGVTVPSYQPGNSVNNWPYWNKKVYTDPVRRAATGDFGGNWLHTIILRYADVLLMAAEAANETGDGATAAKYLEMVRNRASGNLGQSRTLLPYIAYQNQTQMRTAIKKERRVEFAMEFERFYDLVRWTPATDGIDAPTVYASKGYQTKNQYYPIPQPDIDKSNGVLKQNPNY